MLFISPPSRKLETLLTVGEGECSVGHPRRLKVGSRSSPDDVARPKRH